MKLSIIVPAFNAAPYLKISLGSILNQDLTDIEIVVVDDGSSDDTFEIAKGILSVIDKKHYQIIRKNNEGVSVARNIGLHRALGEYIFFLDSDDYISNTFISEISKVIDSKSPDMVSWGYNVVKESDHSIMNRYFDAFSNELVSFDNGIDAIKSSLIYKEFHICSISAVYKKQFLSKYKLLFHNGCVNGEDQEFILKALVNVRSIIFINRTLTNYVDRLGSISNQYNLKRFDVVNAMYRVCRYLENAHFEGIEELNDEIKNNLIISNYFYNLASCIQYANCIQEKNILRDIEDLFPGLNGKILGLSRDYCGKDIKLKIKTRIFIISPKLLIFGLRLYKRVRVY